MLEECLHLLLLLLADLGPYLLQPHPHLLLELVSLWELSSEPGVFLDAFYADPSLGVGIKHHLN